MQIQFAEVELPGMLLDEGEYVIGHDEIILPATTTAQTIHGLCVAGAGALSAYASSTHFALTYSAVSPFAGSVKGWRDRDSLYSEGMTGTPCAGGIYLMPSLFKDTPEGTTISIDVEFDRNEVRPTLCVLIEDGVGTYDGGFPESLAGERFEDFGTFPGFGFSDGTDDLRLFSVWCLEELGRTESPTNSPTVGEHSLFPLSCSLPSLILYRAVRLLRQATNLLYLPQFSPVPESTASSGATTQSTRLPPSTRQPCAPTSFLIPLPPTLTMETSSLNSLDHWK